MIYKDPRDISERFLAIAGDFWDNFLFPFLMKQPLSLLLGPISFVFFVSLGNGAGVEDVLETYEFCIQNDELCI